MASQEAGSPYDLRQGTFPRVDAEAGHVVVRLELVSLRDPLDIQDIQLILDGNSAALLGFEMIEAAKKLR